MARALQETNPAKQARLMEYIQDQISDPDGVRSAAYTLVLTLLMAGPMEALSQDKYGYVRG